MEVTTACNLKCIICEHTYWRERPQSLTYEDFLKIMAQFPSLHWIGMTGIGSSFLNKDYLRMLEYLKRDKRTFVEFFDSFYMFDEEKARTCVELGIDKIWISMESAHREVYNKIRVGSDFDTVVKNIENLIRIKKELRSPLPELWFHFIINKYNEGELLDYVDLVEHFARLEGTKSRPILYFTNMLAFNETADLVANVTKDTVRKVEEYCRKKRLFYVFNENVVCDSPMKECVKWNEPFILVSGHIQPCCAINEANVRQYQTDHAFMNVLQGDFRNFWRSAEMKQFIRTMRGGGINDICKYCHIYKHPDKLRCKPNSTPKQ